MKRTSDFLSRIFEDYKKLVFLCSKEKLDFEFSCSAKENREFVLSFVISNKIRIVIEDTEYLIGKEYFCFIRNLKTNEGRVNFNNKELWNKVLKLHKCLHFIKKNNVRT